MTKFIDLNADLGEDENPQGITRDIGIMDVISSCNIACGGHAGSASIMRRMLQAAQDKDVKIGAHPSYPDRANFGRVSMNIATSDLQASLIKQMNEIQTIAADLGARISHLKAHGALYNDAQDNQQLADVLIEITSRYSISIVGMAGSVLEKRAAEKGMKFIAEAFIDRSYTDASRLVPRNEKGAIIENDDNRIAQGMKLAAGKPVKSCTGKNITIKADTLCLHSDSPGALSTAKAMRQALEEAGIEIRAPAT